MKTIFIYGLIITATFLTSQVHGQDALADKEKSASDSSEKLMNEYQDAKQEEQLENLKHGTKVARKEHKKAKKELKAQKKALKAEKKAQKSRKRADKLKNE